MGWNFRRSKKILPGVRLNFGKKSWGISFGGKHSRISYNSKTGVTARTSIPGTGISYTEKLSGRKKTQSPNGTPPRNHHTGLWVLSVLFAIAGLANLSKSVIGGLLYILAAVATVPIPAVQDRLHALNVRGWVKVVTVIALIVAGTALFPTSAAETPSEAATEPGQQGNAIMLVAGEQGLYGEWFTMNDEAFYIYRVPAGVYRVTNAGKYPAQVNVYKGVVKNAETGFDEYTAVGDVVWMDVSGSGEITVPEGWFIEIHEPTKITLVRTGDAPKPDSVKQTTPAPAVKSGPTVYITNTGKHYHYSSTCNGGHYFPVTLSEAVGLGLTPCDKCA